MVCLLHPSHCHCLILLVGSVIRHAAERFSKLAKQWDRGEILDVVQKIGHEVEAVKPKLVMKMLRHAITGMKVMFMTLRLYFTDGRFLYRTDQLSWTLSTSLDVKGRSEDFTFLRHRTDGTRSSLDLVLRDRPWLGGSMNPWVA
jgi:hypothetical protein